MNKWLLSKLKVIKYSAFHGILSFLNSVVHVFLFNNKRLMNI